jgi:hypothetical protein
MIAGATGGLVPVVEPNRFWEELGAGCKPYVDWGEDDGGDGGAAICALVGGTDASETKMVAMDSIRRTLCNLVGIIDTTAVRAARRQEP